MYPNNINLLFIISSLGILSSMYMVSWNWEVGLGLYTISVAGVGIYIANISTKEVRRSNNSNKKGAQDV